MTDWIPFSQKMPLQRDRVIVCFWWPEGDDFNMVLEAWPYDFEANDWGRGCLPTKWMPAPEYPEDLP
jgi:hypothetical protein